MDSPDLQAKYHKLAFEYSKLRAQNQVLKKAIIEEQNKTSHLKDSLKSRDQSLRKAEQENDSLNFRNQQLTKRLILLQDDLEQIHSKPSKGQFRLENQANSGIMEQNVYAEELELKIKENVRLHAELADTETFYKNKILELETILEESNQKATQKTEGIVAQEQMLQKEIKKLEMERILQEVAAQQRETEMVVLQDKIKSLNANVDTYLLNENRLANNSVSVQSNLSLINQHLESPNKKIDLMPDSMLIKEFVEPIQQLSYSFISFLQSYFVVLNNCSSLTPVQTRLINQFTDDDKVWESMASSFSEIAFKFKDDEDLLLESVTGLETFSKSVSDCSALLRKLLPVISEKISHNKEENEEMSWRSSWGSFVACWAALSPYIMSLAAHSDGRTVLTSSAVIKILNLLSNRLIKLHSLSQDLLVSWKLLTSLDKDQDHITKILQSISDSLSKISSLFCEKVVTCYGEECSNASTPSTVSPGTPQNSHQTGLSFLSSPDSNGWSSGIQDGMNLADSEASLAQQLAHASSRLSKLEEEKEHWRLEFQLLNHKYEKECQKSLQFEDNLKLINPSSQESPKMNRFNQDVNSSYSATSRIGELTGNIGLADEREKEIRNHFTNRCSHLYMQLTACASQAALYQNECETLIRRQALCEESKAMSEQEIEHQRKEVSQLMENLSTTSRNYEEQISTMSDHLADLNEKITSQADFIEQLKFEIKKKGKK